VLILDIAANEQQLAKEYTVLVMVPPNCNWSSGFEAVGGVISKGDFEQYYKSTQLCKPSDLSSLWQELTFE